MSQITSHYRLAGTLSKASDNFQLYVYPIKTLRGISLTHAEIDRQGIKNDRTFMLLRSQDGDSQEPPEAVEIPRYPMAALFRQHLENDCIVVSYHMPIEPLLKPIPKERLETLHVPLQPDIATLTPMHVDLYGSATTAYHMSEPYNHWFSACFGFRVELMYIGDGKRPVLGSFSPAHPSRSLAVASTPSNNWLPSSLRSLVAAPSSRSTRQDEQDPHYLTFTCGAAFLVTSEASLAEVSKRLPDGQDMDMRKYRPNIVVDGEVAWDEDYWGKLAIKGPGTSPGTGLAPNSASASASQQPQLTLMCTANCGRCISVNVDYSTGKPAVGEMGAVLKKLMKDRRVDAGMKYTPVFGRYSFLLEERGELRVGDEVMVAERKVERDVWDGPP